MKDGAVTGPAIAWGTGTGTGGVRRCSREIKKREISFFLLVLTHFHTVQPYYKNRNIRMRINNCVW